MRVGSVELLHVPDAVGLLAELGEVYPDVPAEGWEQYRGLYPELFSGTSWRLPCNCFLVRSHGVSILVDTGVGPAGLWDWGAEREGLLPSALEALGIGRHPIDVVFLTHLHIDHLGWNTDEDGAVFFPRARYVVHRDRSPSRSSDPSSGTLPAASSRLRTASSSSRPRRSWRRASPPLPCRATTRGTWASGSHPAGRRRS